MKIIDAITSRWYEVALELEGNRTVNESWQDDADDQSAGYIRDMVAQIDGTLADLATTYIPRDAVATALTRHDVELTAELWQRVRAELAGRLDNYADQLLEEVVLDVVEDTWAYFEAYLGTEHQPQALNVWGWGTHEEAREAMCQYVGAVLSEAADELHTTDLCVDYDSHGIAKGERATVLVIRKSLSVADRAHPVLAETTTTMKKDA